jgi:rfaE bifunctional protein nucleotidyltransferase chain/domain
VNHDPGSLLTPPVGLAKWLDWPPLLDVRAALRAAGRTVVWTNGCFDLLHVGHLRNLQAAKRHGDVLIVGVNSDDSVRRLKGQHRPLLPETQRAEVLCGLSCVDYVVLFDEPTPEEALARLKPEVHCKGADYAPPGGKPIPEAALVASYGGRVEFLPLVDGLSTSALLERVRRLPES